MTRYFYIYTAIIEALTGIGLILIPSVFTHLLLDAELNGAPEKIPAMIGGAAIFSIALLSWTRSDSIVGVSLPILLFYNIAVTFILLYAALGLDCKGIPLYMVIAFHLFQSIMCIVLLKKQKPAAKLDQL
jgi:hypothetical protein